MDGTETTRCDMSGAGWEAGYTTEGGWLELYISWAPSHADGGTLARRDGQDPVHPLVLLRRWLDKALPYRQEHRPGAGGLDNRPEHHGGSPGARGEPPSGGHDLANEEALWWQEAIAKGYVDWVDFHLRFCS